MQAQKYPTQIANKYVKGELISEGSEGYVCRFEHRDNKQIVAIKIQKDKNQQTTFIEEKTVMKFLTDQKHLDRFPKYIDYSNFESKRYLVMEFLPQSVEDLIETREKKGEVFLDIVKDIAIQMVECLQQIHSVGYVHRDLKPANFRIKDGRVIIVDFGLTFTFKDNQLQKHKTQEKVRFVGTPCYSSIDAHRGFSQSRKDDLEALGYTIYSIMNKGQPIWTITEGSSLSVEIHKQYLEEKTNLVEGNGISHELAIIQEYLAYCRSLQFDEEPNYEYLKKLLNNTCPCYIANDASLKLISPRMKTIVEDVDLKQRTIKKVLDQNKDMRFDTVINGLPEEQWCDAMDKYINQQNEEFKNVLKGGQCQYVQDKIVKPGKEELTTITDRMIMGFRDHCKKHFPPLIQSASDTIFENFIYQAIQQFLNSEAVAKAKAEAEAKSEAERIAKEKKEANAKAQKLWQKISTMQRQQFNDSKRLLCQAFAIQNRVQNACIRKIGREFALESIKIVKKEKKEKDRIDNEKLIQSLRDQITEKDTTIHQQKTTIQIHEATIEEAIQAKVIADAQRQEQASDIQSLRDQIYQKDTRIQEYKIEIEDSKKAKEKDEQLISEQAQALLELNDTKNELNSQLSNSILQIEYLQETIKLKEQKIKEVIDKKVNKASIIKGKDAEISEWRLKHEIQGNRLNEKNKENLKLQADLDSEKNKVQQHQTQYEEQKNIYEAKIKSINDENERIMNITKEEFNVEKEKQIQEEVTKNNLLQKAYYEKQYQQICIPQQEKIQTLEQDLNTANTNLQAKNQELEAISKDKIQLQKDLEFEKNKQVAYNQKDGMITQYQTEVKQKNKEISSLQQENVELKKQIQDLKSIIQSLLQPMNKQSIQQISSSLEQVMLPSYDQNQNTTRNSQSQNNPLNKGNIDDSDEEEDKFENIPTSEELQQTLKEQQIQDFYWSCLNIFNLNEEQFQKRMPLIPELFNNNIDYYKIQEFIDQTNKLYIERKATCSFRNLIQFYVGEIIKDPNSSFSMRYSYDQAVFILAANSRIIQKLDEVDQQEKEEEQYRANNGERTAITPLPIENDPKSFGAIKGSYISDYHIQDQQQRPANNLDNQSDQYLNFTESGNSTSSQSLNHQQYSTGHAAGRKNYTNQPNYENPRKVSGSGVQQANKNSVIMNPSQNLPNKWETIDRINEQQESINLLNREEGMNPKQNQTDQNPAKNNPMKPNDSKKAGTINAGKGIPVKGKQIFK